MSVVLLSFLAGCNSYEVFALAGYEQASYSNDADVLFVIDNSNSMWQESGEMALNFNAFVDYLTNPNAGGVSTDDLADAVDNYVSFVTRRGVQIDYQLAITTTSVDIAAGPTAQLDPGEAGTFVGTPEIMTADSGSAGDDFRQALLCETTCWPSAEDKLPDDKNYVCGEPTDQISTDYLNCPENCGVGKPGWDTDHCGSGSEEPLEAAFEALCRSVENPPAACFETPSALTKADAHTNEPLVRPEGTVVVVIVTDEGDNSRRLAEGDPDPATYLELFGGFENRVKFAAIGPDYDAENDKLICNNAGAPRWSIERLQTVASVTGGFYDPISVPAPDATDINDCVVADFAEHLIDLGELLNSLISSFKLRSIPDESTIRAFVDGKEVPKAELISGNPGTVSAVYGDGWSYDPSENAVTFWGDAIPDYNQDVEIIYLPLEGNPRDFPF
jgi:hypothetical protein